jgi:hypothetical protein
MGYDSNGVGPQGALPPVNRQSTHLSTWAGSVNAALRERGLVDRWASSTENWSTRLAIGSTADKALSGLGLDQRLNHLRPKLDTFQPQLKDIAQNAVSYRQLMGLGKTAEEMAKAGSNGFAYHTVAWKDVLEKGKFKEAVSKNFANAFKTNDFNRNLTAGSFVKNTLYKDNFRRIADTLTTGKNIGSGAASAAGLGIFAYDLYSQTKNTYEAHKAAERGTIGDRIDTLKATAHTFVTTGLKNAAAWEVGTAGFAVGASLTCIGTAGAGIVTGAWLPIVGGVVVGALASTLTKVILNQVIPDSGPPKPKKPLQNQMA